MDFLRKIILPGSKLYNEDSPLREEIEIKNLTVAEEKLFLTNSGAIAFDKMLNKCIKEPVSLTDMFVSDKAYVLFQIRSLTYGDTFNVTLKCECGTVTELPLSITALPENRIEC